MIRRGQARRAPRVSTTTTKIIVGIAVAAIVVALLLSGGGQTPQGNNRGVVPSGQGSVAPANMRGSSTVGYTLPPVSAPPAKQSVVKSTPPVKAPASAVAGYTPPKEATTYSLSSWKKYWEDRGLSYSGGYELRSKNDFTRDGKYLYVYVKETNSIRIHDLGDIRWSQDLKHSQIAGGKDVYGAGHFEVKNGKLLSIDNASGHYKPDYVSIDTSGDSPQLVYSGGSVEMVRDKVKSLGIDVSKTSLRTFVSGSQIDELNRMKSAKLGFSSNLGTAAVAPDQFKVIGKNGRLEI